MRHRSAGMPRQPSLSYIAGLQRPALRTKFGHRRRAEHVGTSARNKLQDNEEPMSATPVKATVKIAPNNPVFDLPVIVGIEEGLFAKAGLDVSFSASYADREKDSAQTAFMARLKESQFDC